MPRGALWPWACASRPAGRDAPSTFGEKGEYRVELIGGEAAAKVTDGLAAVEGQLPGGLLVSANIDETGWRPRRTPLKPPKRS
jgi:hypothetical protein